MSIDVCVWEWVCACVRVRVRAQAHTCVCLLQRCGPTVACMLKSEENLGYHSLHSTFIKTPVLFCCCCFSLHTPGQLAGKPLELTSLPPCCRRTGLTDIYYYSEISMDSGGSTRPLPITWQHYVPYCCFWDSVSLCIAGWPEIHDSPASSSWVLVLKFCTAATCISQVFLEMTVAQIKERLSMSFAGWG